MTIDQILEAAKALPANQLGSLTNALLEHAGVIIFQSVSISDVRDRLDENDMCDDIPEDEFRSKKLTDEVILEQIEYVANGKDCGRWACAMIDQVMEMVEDCVAELEEAV